MSSSLLFLHDSRQRSANPTPRDVTITKCSSYEYCQHDHYDHPCWEAKSGNLDRQESLSSVSNQTPPTTCSSHSSEHKREIRHYQYNDIALERSLNHHNHSHVEVSSRKITLSFQSVSCPPPPSCTFNHSSESYYGLSLFVPSSSSSPPVVVVMNNQQLPSSEIKISHNGGSPSCPPFGPPIHSPVANSSSQTTLSPNSPNCNSLSPSEKRPLKFFDYNKRKIAKKVRRVDQVQPYEHVIQMQTTTANKKNSPTSRSSILSPNTRNSIQNKDGSNTTTNTTPNESALLPSGQQEQPLLRREANTHETFSHGSNPPVATTTTTTATRKRTPRYSISIKELLN